MNHPCTLPNGLSVHHLNEYETTFLYSEIFVDKIYSRHGIKLSPGACVLDIGANIGLFSLFIKQLEPSARIFTIEPSPDHRRVLESNLASYAKSVTILSCGMGESDRTETFTYYPGCSVFSGFHADIDQDRLALATVIRNQLQERSNGQHEVSERAVELHVGDRLEGAREFDCQVRNISSLIREWGLESIDLLKIDAEKSECGILKGIDDDDWPKVRQIVLEAHDQETTREIVSCLRDRGFVVRTQAEGAFADSGFVNIYAVRQSAAVGESGACRHTNDDLAATALASVQR